MSFKRDELIRFVEFTLTVMADGEDGRDIVDTVIGHMIRALRADSGLPARTTLQWEEFFAGAIDRATYELRRLDGLIQPREAISAVKDFFRERELDAERAAPPQASVGA